MTIQQECRQFVEKYIKPFANQHDQQERIPAELIQQIAQAGYLETVLPPEYGGRNMDMLSFGLINEEFAKGCSATKALLTTQSMVQLSLLKWGNTEQKSTWLPKLASGESIAAFALTEPDIGSDVKHIQMTAELQGSDYILNGTKKWITLGQLADIFLIFAKCHGKITAFLVPRDTEGLSIKPITGLLGMRAAMLAKLELQNCRVPQENIVGAVGFGFTHVMLTALDYGRYSIAWGAVGLAQACLEDCLQYTANRSQFQVPIKEHQLIKHMITDMVVDISAARNLCYQAGYLKDTKDSDSILATLVAKYFAAKVAFKIASDTVQIHGANGCGNEYAAQRHFRDAKIMEIIEGSNEVLQNFIAQSYRRYSA